jgi:hypothetical protein
MDVVWLDVEMWTGLQGNFLPFTDVECPAPEPLPADDRGWHQWAGAYLSAVAAQDGWQSGRYHYIAESRDDAGRPLEVFARGFWEWGTDPTMPRAGAEDAAVRPHRL